MTACVQFNELRAASDIDNSTFADRVCRMDIFLQKWALVRTVLAAGGADSHVLEDAVQQAFLDARQYLAQTRGSSFTGDSDDALGAWFYTLLKRNATWRYFKMLRGRRHQEGVADRPHENLPPQMYLNAWQAFVGEFTAFSQFEQSVFRDAMNGVEVAESAAKHGVSQRSISRYRKALYNRIQAALRELV